MGVVSCGRMWAHAQGRRKWHHTLCIISGSYKCIGGSAAARLRQRLSEPVGGKAGARTRQPQLHTERHRGQSATASVPYICKLLALRHSTTRKTATAKEVHGVTTRGPHPCSMRSLHARAPPAARRPDPHHPNPPPTLCINPSEERPLHNANPATSTKSAGEESLTEQKRGPLTRPRSSTAKRE